MMKMTFRTTLLAIFISMVFTGTAMADGWEVNIAATTSTGAENRISFGQKDDATDGFDGQYEVPAYVEGSISAYFPHPEWAEVSAMYWRDIRSTDTGKSWIFNVGSSLGGASITLSWKSSRLPAGYALTLLDMATGETIDMAAAQSYVYTNGGVRQFTVTSVELASP
jgi:hypothetical protein